MKGSRCEKTGFLSLSRQSEKNDFQNIFYNFFCPKKMIFIIFIKTPHIYFWTNQNTNYYACNHLLADLHSTRCTTGPPRTWGFQWPRCPAFPAFPRPLRASPYHSFGHKPLPDAQNIKSQKQIGQTLRAICTSCPSY